MHREDAIINSATTEARDVWSLGLTLSLLLDFFIPAWMLIHSGDPTTTFRMILAYTELPEPSTNSPEHLVWRMIRKDPRERISANEARENLSLIEWSRK